MKSEQFACNDISEPYLTTETVSSEDMVKNSSGSISRQVIGADQNLLKGIMKFSSKVKSQSSAQLATALHCFGSLYKSKSLSSKSSKSKSLIPRAKKGKINVQPEAIKHRRSGLSKSKRNVFKGRKTVINAQIPVKGNYSAKRQHDFKENVKMNQPVSKKAERNMSTRTKPFLKKRLVLKEVNQKPVKAPKLE